MIQMYYDKWWKNHGHHQENVCNTKKTMDQKAMANALGVVNIGGIFVVLLCGLAFAVIVAILEFCWSNHLDRSSFTRNPITNGKTAANNEENNDEEKRSLCTDLWQSFVPFFVNRKQTDMTRSPARMRRSDCSSCSLTREQTNL